MDKQNEGLQPLSGNQAKALIALLSCKSIRDAAKEAKLSTRTIYKYLNEKNFQEHYKNQQGEMIADNLRRLNAMTGDALTTLHDMLSDKDVNPATKVRSATALLANFIKWRGEVEIEGRLQQLEKAVSNEQISN